MEVQGALGTATPCLDEHPVLHLGGQRLGHCRPNVADEHETCVLCVSQGIDDIGLVEAHALPRRRPAGRRTQRRLFEDLEHGYRVCGFLELLPCRGRAPLEVCRQGVADWPSATILQRLTKSGDHLTAYLEG